MSIILPRGRDIVITRVYRWEMKTYAELCGDVQKQEIKSSCDNKIGYLGIKYLDVGRSNRRY